MAILTELYIATRTRNVGDAETDNPPVIVLRRAGNVVTSRQLFSSYLADRGGGAVFRFDIGDEQIDSADLDVELWASGDDAWSPEHVIVWGIAGEVRSETVIPLAAFLDLADPMTADDRGVWVSGDSDEGDRMLFIPRVGRGSDGTRARRVIVVTATTAYGAMFTAGGPGGPLEDSGTVGPLTLQAGAAGKLMLDYTLPATPQSDQESGGGGFYVVDLAAPFSRADLQGGAFTLTIQTEDWWVPGYFAVFGADTPKFGPNALIPFVAASAFDLKQMSSDPDEGWHSIVLPTARVLPERRFPPGGEVGEDHGGVLEAAPPGSGGGPIL